jgi:8-oxo-dGTP pyrophosphatase MutT (NUDIX family)
VKTSKPAKGTEPPPDKPRVRRQYGVLPFRMEPELEIMLLTSRDTRRWVIPKGWPMKGRKAHQSAAQEALEEAGVIGKTSSKALGAYSYMKLAKSGELVPCKVKVFPLRVRRQLDAWPEQEERETRWFPPDEAAASVQEEELAAIIRSFAEAKS